MRGHAHTTRPCGKRRLVTRVTSSLTGRLRVLARLQLALVLRSSSRLQQSSAVSAFRGRAPAPAPGAMEALPSNTERPRNQKDPARPAAPWTPWPWHFFRGRVRWSCAAVLAARQLKLSQKVTAAPPQPQPLLLANLNPNSHCRGPRLRSHQPRRCFCFK